MTDLHVCASGVLTRVVASCVPKSRLLARLSSDNAQGAAPVPCTEEVFNIWQNVCVGQRQAPGEPVVLLEVVQVRGNTCFRLIALHVQLKQSP